MVKRKNFYFKPSSFYSLDTYVNYEQDEATMIREALQASLLHQ